ncbi:unnamed protein product [Allacma fusca]|uniref:Fibronectin type-III domain-containing protein n=1 Tax=Allacma fusca TaxID=39272 RepID=A0A8J2KUE1_9HEXA|nr:unnamed protein product [Allacma fusca]
MVSSAGEISPAHHELIYSPLTQSNASNSPNMMSCEYHPAYGHIPPDCTYYPGPESYQYCSPESYPHPQMCAVNTEYGPMTVPLVSTNSNPPIPLPMQVPQGHVVQQIVDENGTLRHVIVSHQPPLMPIPFLLYKGPGSQSQPFYPPGPGFPGHFPGMQAGVPCGVPSTQGPPTPPGPNSLNAGAYVGHLPAHAHKDERAQRQYVKLRRKFELKQQRDREMTSLTPSFYHQNGGSRKAESGGYNNNNSQRRNVPNGTLKSPNGGIVEEDGSVGSTGSVTSTGTQDEEEESRIQAQTEMLSTLIPPVVSEVASQSALIQWSHPDRFTESGENRFPELDVSDTDFQYDVYIMDKTRDSRFKSIFTGSALSCRVKDLKPGTIYAISYCALLNDMKGSMSVATNFTTLPDVPDPPSSLRAVSRSRSSIQFKWNPVANPNDNGAKVTSYVLEYDEGKGGSNYVEAYRGKNKQCTVSKLQPAYSYQFRVAAVNQCGQSRYSSTVQVMTAGSPPSQPAPPTLTEAGGTYLTLEWKCRPTDDEYTLQMEDPSTGHGFLCVYNGNAPHYTCIALRRNTQYKFRVKAQNEEGHSKWSEEVTLKTLPGQPGPPHKPCLKGRVHSNSFKVRWDPPSEDGGVPISAYALEIDQGNGGFEEIYRGSEAEFNIDKLSPGQSYALRVIAVGPGGESVPSESCVITTEPVCPGKCNIPRIVGKPKSNSVHLRWNPPDWDGGSPVNQYEVGCTTPDNLTQEAYRGKETDCFVNRLLPGRAYLFQIRAFNRIGAGPWSDPLEVVSGAGAPDVPAPVQVHTKTAHMVILSWAEPLNNGSAVTEYRVQMATVAVESPEEESSSSAVDNSPVEQSAESTPIVHTPTVAPTPAPTATSSFCQVFLGPALSCEVKSLQPATVYLFRVQATNSAGSSDWSPVTTHQMPASSPNAVSSVEATASSDSISLCWVPPSSNGACILQYNVSIGEAIFVTTTNSYVVDNLMADTHYKIRVQAVNGVGPGPYSSVIKISTKPLPPQPPKLECVSTAHFWMKLKWNETSSKNIEYLIQMISPYQDEFQVVYRGSNPYCKVTRLAEDTQYKFRVCALNGAGQGPFSDMYHFSTLKAPPPQVKGLKVEVMLEAELCRLEWSPVACADTTAYQLQLAKLRDQEFKTIFRGEERKYEMDAKELEEGVEYTARVCAIRQCDDSSQLVGPYSNAVSFTVQQPQMLDSNSSKRNSTPFSKNISSASPLRSNFLNVIEEKLGNISFESRVGIVAVFALIILAFVISLITHHVVS